MPKVLIVEDDKFQNQTLASWFSKRGYSVDQCYNCADAQTFLMVSTYDLIMLDWELPDGEGVKMLNEQRHKGLVTPVIILTGKSTIDDKEIGFDSGADDYLTKPFQERELDARVKAILRRPPTYVDSEIKVGDLIVCQTERVVRAKDGTVALTPKEFEVFLFLSRHLGTVFSPEAILMRAWGTDSETTSDNIRKYIQRIRTKLQDGSRAVSIVNHHGLGYSLHVESEES